MFRRLFAFLLLFPTVLGQSALHQACDDLNFERHAYGYGSCFVLDWDTSGSFWEWDSKCTHIGTHAARLATVESTVLAEWLKSTVLLNAPQGAWVALTQSDSNDEPTGNFEWVKGDNYTRVAEPYVAGRWNTAPSDSGAVNCAEMDETGFTEADCSATKAYICAYDEPKIHRKFILEADGLVGTDILDSRDLTNPEPVAKRLACGTMCGKRDDCFAFSIDETGGTCKLHKDIVLNAPAIDTAFKLFKHN